MNAFIDFYLSKKKLKSDFASASGVLKEKEILILAFRRQDEVEFAFELPLSPSMGETIPDVLEQAKVGKHSNYLQVAMSYFKALIVEKQSIPSSKHLSDFIDVATYGIGENSESQSNTEAVIRLKGSPLAIKDIVEFSYSTKNRFIIDFNQSLSREQFQDFSTRVSLEKILYIEQPLAKNEILPHSPFPVWADESISYYQNIEKILEQGFSGFVLKPLHYKFDKLVEIVEASNTHRVPSIIGGVISDSLHAGFLNAFQTTTSLKVKNLDLSLAGDLQPSLSLENPYRVDSHTKLIFDKKGIIQLNDQYERVYSMKVEI